MNCFESPKPSKFINFKYLICHLGYKRQNIYLNYNYLFRMNPMEQVTSMYSTLLESCRCKVCGGHGHKAHQCSTKDIMDKSVAHNQPLKQAWGKWKGELKLANYEARAKAALAKNQLEVSRDSIDWIMSSQEAARRGESPLVDCSGYGEEGDDHVSSLDPADKFSAQREMYSQATQNTQITN